MTCRAAALLALLPNLAIAALLALATPPAAGEAPLRARFADDAQALVALAGLEARLLAMPGQGVVVVQGPAGTAEALRRAGAAPVRAAGPIRRCGAAAAADRRPAPRRAA